MQGFLFAQDPKSKIYPGKLYRPYDAPFSCDGLIMLPGF